MTLYKTNSFVVRLATIALEDEILTSHVFSTVRKGNSELDLFELYDRLQAP